MERTHQRWHLLIMMMVIVWSVCCAGTPEGAAVLVVSTRDDGDRVTVEQRGEHAVLDVVSGRGMGAATVTLQDGVWPDSLSLHLHLAGLEGFEISNGEVTLGISVLVRVDSLRILRWRRAHDEDDEIQIEPHDHYWSRVQALDGAGQPTDRLPLADGQLVIDLPPRFAGANTRALEISWVDYYRQ